MSDDLQIGCGESLYSWERVAYVGAGDRPVLGAVCLHFLKKGLLCV